MKNNKNTKKITVIIPCYNESAGIARVITSFHKKIINDHRYELEIMVVDNNSSDNTASIAKSFGATVLYEKNQGKGNAIRLGFNSISDDTDFIVMLDGDDTYRPEEVLRLIEPLNLGLCDAVIGSRLDGHIVDGSMTTLNRFGNLFFSYIVRMFYGVKVTDVLTGYFAWKREALVKLSPHLTSDGFAIEMEMVTKMAKLGEKIYSVPISYHARAGETNLHPFYDGLRILLMFARNLFWYPYRHSVDTIFPTFISDQQTIEN